MITNEELQAFCEAVDKKIIAWLGEGFETIHRFKPTTFMRGDKLARIVANHSSSRMAFCFVDLETGNIYKCGGWKAPEPKRHIRGNIANGAADVTPHGAQYRY